MVRWTKEFRSTIATCPQANAYVIHTTSTYATTRPSTSTLQNHYCHGPTCPLYSVSRSRRRAISRIIRPLKLAMLTESLEQESTGI
jgi:hypothetical protein